MDLIEVHTHGAYDIKGLGRIHLIRTSDLPDRKTLAIGDVVLFKGARMRVRGIDLLRITKDVIGVIFEAD